MGDHYEDEGGVNNYNKNVLVDRLTFEVEDYIHEGQPIQVIKFAMEKITRDHGKRIAKEVAEILDLKTQYPGEFK